MKSLDKEEKEFLEGVRRRVRYLEYLKEKEEMIEKNKFEIRRRKLKLGAFMSIFTFLIIAFVFASYGTDMAPLLIIGFILITAGGMYQYIVDIGVGEDET